MTLGHYFVAVNIANSVFAALAYSWSREWNEATYWAAAAVLTGAVLWRSW